MRERSLRYLSSLGVLLTLALTLLLGCAPEEEGTPVVGRPKSPTPTPTTNQTSNQQLTGGIKNSNTTVAGTPTNPPPPEPTPLPTFSPTGPPSLGPIVVGPTTDPAGDGNTEPTPDTSVSAGSV